jgi:hypothetical protein
MSVERTYSPICLVSDVQLIETIRPLFFDLPSRRSSSVIYICETFQPGDLAYSLPSEYYIATYLVWSEAKDDQKHNMWLKNAYRKVADVSCGTYVADFDANMRMTKVLGFKSPILTKDHDRQGMEEMGWN